MSRNKARVIAMQALFQLDKQDGVVWRVIESLMEEESLDENDIKYLNNIASQIIKNMKEIDDYIQQYSIDWDITRLGKVERSILRLSIGEMLYAKEDVPMSVSINEAVRLAKKFGTEQSAKFINGILGKFSRKRMGKTKD